MTSKNRRDFLRAAAHAAGSATALSMLPLGIRNALAIPANNTTGTIRDVEHIVVLMQENRSFDHYFGTLKGVRGFGDTRAIIAAERQVGVVSAARRRMPTAMCCRSARAAPNLGLQFLQDLAHDWNTTHTAWNGGRYDQWVPAKGTTTMAYLTREDIPFHYQLADAFTICDAYHCSLMGPTDPNRYYMWTGWVGNDGSGGGPVIDNCRARLRLVDLSGSTAERGHFLEDLSGHRHRPECATARGAGRRIRTSATTATTRCSTSTSTGTRSRATRCTTRRAPAPMSAERRRYFDILKRDVQNNTLPQVSWIVAPEAYSEHPNWPPNYGAWYVDQVLQILTSNPEVWSKTVLLINYDENDGFFDHVAPPFAPAASAQWSVDGRHHQRNLSTGNGQYAAGVNASGPYGLGPRVPMLVVSPWSKGGYVCSELFDHTSVIRFIEKRFGQQARPRRIEHHAVASRGVRRSDVGVQLRNPNDAVPAAAEHERLCAARPESPSGLCAAAAARAGRAEAGTGRAPGARAALRIVRARARRRLRQGKLTMRFVNTGRAGAVFLVYAAQQSATHRAAIRSKPASVSQDQLPLNADGTYDYTVYGPNGFLRRFAGKPVARRTGGTARKWRVRKWPKATTSPTAICNCGWRTRARARCQFTIINAYDREQRDQAVRCAAATPTSCISICATPMAGTT